MKKLLLTLIVFGGAAAGICYYKGITPADIRDWIDAHSGALKGKTPAQVVVGAAKGAGELAGEITDAVSDALPSEEEIEGIPERLATLRARLADREKAIREANMRLCPYLERAAELKRKFDAATARADRLREKLGDTAPQTVQAAQDLAVLRIELTKANDRYVAWKKANASRLQSPDSDREYREIAAEIERLEHLAD